ncbi:MAG: hypothetical protein ACOCVA_00815 [Prolixibacteraceae bacterium]
MKTLFLQSKSKPNVKFEITVETNIGVYNNYQRFTLNPINKRVDIKEREGKKCIYISSFNFDATLKNYIKNTFGVQVKKGNLYLQITDESWNQAQTLISDFETEVEKFKADLEKRRNEMPVKYYMYEFLDWGDYTINNEREIQIWRKALPEENGEEVMKTSYKLWNNSIEGYSDKWATDFEAAGGKESKSDKVAISEETAEKWIAVWKNVQAEKARKEAEEEAKREAAERAEKERRDNCFREARETGKPVLLHSCFLTGSDIPRKFRDDDSDMGNLLTYAMPDGSVKEEFSHAY